MPTPVLGVLANCQAIINQLLNRNRGSYSASGGTGANAIGAFPFDTEITDALIRADGLVITEGYFESEKAALRNRFLTASSNLVDGAKMPEFGGQIGKAEWSINGTDWFPSKEQESRDDVADANLRGSYVGATAFYGMHHFDGTGYVYHSSPYFRFEYPVYVKTTVLQSLEQHEPLVINWALELLYKGNVQTAFDWYKQIRGELLERVIKGAMRLTKPQPLPADLGSDA